MISVNSCIWTAFKFSIIAIASIATLTACETPNDNTIESARQCLDQATKISLSNPGLAATNAQSCDTMISSSTLAGTTAGAGIEFGAILVEQQKISQIASMIQSIGTSSGAIDGINAAISTMVFGNLPSGEQAIQSATRLQNAGNVLGSGAQTIGSLVYMSTFLNSIGTITTPANALTELQSVAPGGGNATAANQLAVASAAQSMEASACANPSDNTSTSPSNVCFKMKQALGTASTPAAICTALANYAATTH